MRIRHGLCVYGILLFAATPLDAQVSVEARLGGAMGNHQPAAAGLQTHPGLALAASIEYAATSAVSAYAGYTHASFECRDGFCADDGVTFTSHGISTGVMVETLAGIRVRGGIVRNRVDAPNSEARAGIGFEGGVGYALDMGRGVEVRPQVAMRRHGGTTGGVDGTTTVLTAAVGVALRIRRP